MRILHCADWHLGRRLHGVDLIDDQRHALDQLCAIAREARVDLVVVAGDLFDRAQPPAEAIALLDETWSRLVGDLGLAVIAIAGNHDSPARIDYGGALLAQRGLRLVGGLERARPIRFEDEHGPIEFTPLPFAEPSRIAAALDIEGPLDGDRAFAALLASQPAPRAARRVLIGHLFARGGGASESERPLAIGGGELVDPERFAGFCYAALGHLHRPQRVGENARYAGSLLKYSASEAAGSKSVAIVEIDAAGAARVELIELSPKRDLRVIEGPFAELLALPKSSDFVIASYDDRATPFDPMGRLRERFPNVLAVSRMTPELASEPGSSAASGPTGDLTELFEGFFAFAQGEPADAAERSAIEGAFARWRAGEREV